MLAPWKKRLKLPRVLQKIKIMEKTKRTRQNKKKQLI